jgi:hypothetical protein
MPAVNDVGKPCAGEPYARFDGRELETEYTQATATAVGHPTGNCGNLKAAGPTAMDVSPRQLPTLQPPTSLTALPAPPATAWEPPAGVGVRARLRARPGAA